MRVSAPNVVDELQLWDRRARTEHLSCGLRECSQLRVPVCRLVDGVAVDPERHVVEKDEAVHLRDVDRSLDAVSERLERAYQVVSVDTEVEREMVAGTRRNAHEREPVRPRRGGNRRH